MAPFIPDSLPDFGVLDPEFVRRRDALTIELPADITLRIRVMAEVARGCAVHYTVNGRDITLRPCDWKPEYGTVDMRTK